MLTISIILLENLMLSCVCGIDRDYVTISIDNVLCGQIKIVNTKRRAKFECFHPRKRNFLHEWISYRKNTIGKLFEMKSSYKMKV